jgi:hypothetical protein
MMNNPININKLKRQRDELDMWINNLENTMQQSPVNNFINTNQSSNTQNNSVEWRVLNENEDVSNLYVQSKTLFVGANMMILKGTDGKLEKWEINKIYPVDEKDLKIKELEKQINELKGMINNEYTEPNKSTSSISQSNANANGNDKSSTATTNKSTKK